MADADAIASRLGIALTPWQRELAQRMLAGERIPLKRGNRYAMINVLKVIAEADRERGGDRG